MSSTTPAGEPEYLELGSHHPRKPGRGLISGIIVGVVVALGLPLGAFAVFRILGGGGTQPHDVLPANAVSYLRVDLDPAAPQKIDAIRFLRTFPAFERYTRITDDRADLRRVVFDAIAADAPCGLDYGQDVEPWLGERLGVAVVPPNAGDTQPGVAVAIQVSDEGKARAGLERLSSCGASSDVGGWSYLDGYMVVSDSQQAAAGLTEAAARLSLADTPQFADDMEHLGDQGVASAWLSGDGLFQLWRGAMIGDPGPAGAELDRLRAQSQEAIEATFQSAAVALRFDDRYAELATVVTGTSYRAASDGGAADMALPESTAVAVGFADGRQYVDRQWQLMADLATGGPGWAGTGAPTDEKTAKIERQTGLRLPEDLKTLVGDSFTLALDGKSLDIDALLGSADPQLLDLGARVSTNTAAFSDIIAKLEGKANAKSVPVDLVVQETADGAVVALNDSYASKLGEGGSLADSDVFQTAVRNADEAQGVFFCNFDALEGQIAEQLRRTGENPELVDNLTKLEALGVSGTTRDGYTEAALRVTVGD